MRSQDIDILVDAIKKNAKEAIGVLDNFLKSNSDEYTKAMDNLGLSSQNSGVEDFIKAAHQMDGIETVMVLEQEPGASGVADITPRSLTRSPEGEPCPLIFCARVT